MSLRETPSVFFFFNDTATTEIYTLSLHDALPISRGARGLGPALRRRDRAREADPRAGGARRRLERRGGRAPRRERPGRRCRSGEHTSELQSRLHLVCPLLLGKKKTPEHDRNHPPC